MHSLQFNVSKSISMGCPTSLEGTLSYIDDRTGAVRYRYNVMHHAHAGQTIVTLWQSMPHIGPQATAERKIATIYLPDGGSRHAVKCVYVFMSTCKLINEQSEQSMMQFQCNGWGFEWKGDGANVYLALGGRAIASIRPSSPSQFRTAVSLHDLVIHNGMGNAIVEEALVATAVCYYVKFMSF
ncbi:hypothetical protein FISHEDRAFT_70227 [Fistulina hepatica ATCC 64428]|uniref:Uncharacterized protein n=1 Tax=Fistulina hepatica ATCC 64428 TaxID=1128425 RepID=A0A0D7AJE9_9AGAR|nr:hypothetical protein FISHEDRAFT_70227 [Fistulina hepatica ATCC 64428]